MDTRRKLIIQANPAQYDASCASRPGLGMRSFERSLLTRRGLGVRRADLDRLRVRVVKLLPFVALPGHQPKDGDSAPLRHQVRPCSVVGAAAARRRQTDPFA